MADVFISYSKHDRALAVGLSNFLNDCGYTVWWDASLVVGDRFDQAISDELSKASAVIVIWTPSSVKSDYVIGEARQARKEGKLLPTHVESLRPGDDLPFDLRNLQVGVVTDRERILHALAARGVEPVGRDGRAEQFRLWLAIQQRGDPKELRAFLAEHSNGPLAALVRSKLADMEGEAWAAKPGTVTELDAFLNKFPDGKYTLAARERRGVAFAQEERQNAERQRLREQAAERARKRRAEEAERERQRAQQEAAAAQGRRSRRPPLWRYGAFATVVALGLSLYVWIDTGLGTSFRPDGPMLPIVSGNTIVIPFADSINVYNISDRKLLVTVPNALSAQFNGDGSRLLIGDTNTHRLFDTSTWKEEARLKVNMPSWQFRYSPDLRWAVDGGGSLHDLVSGKHLAQLGHLSGVGSVEVSPTGKRLIVQKSGGAWLWNTETFKEVAFLTKHVLHTARFSADGRTILGKLSEGITLLWDAESGRQLHELKKSDSRTTGNVGFSPDGKLVFTSAYTASGQRIRIWDVESGRLLIEGGGSCNALGFNPTGAMLVAECSSNVLKILDVSTGALQKELSFTAFVSAHAFSPDGMRLATGGSDGTIKVWHISGSEIAHLSAIGCDLFETRCERSIIFLGFDLSGRYLAAVAFRSYYPAPGKVVGRIYDLAN